MMYESAFERKLVTAVRRRGGRAYKWVCPGTPGAPDRICVFPRGRVVFVEVKRPGVSDGLSIRQRKFRQTLKDLGCAVLRISSIEELERYLDGV